MSFASDREQSIYHFVIGRVVDVLADSRTFGDERNSSLTGGNKLAGTMDIAFKDRTFNHDLQTSANRIVNENLREMIMQTRERLKSTQDVLKDGNAITGKPTSLQQTLNLAERISNSIVQLPPTDPINDAAYNDAVSNHTETSHLPDNSTIKAELQSMMFTLKDIAKVQEKRMQHILANASKLVLTMFRLARFVSPSERDTTVPMLFMDPTKADRMIGWYRVECYVCLEASQAMSKSLSTMTRALGLSGKELQVLPAVVGGRTVENARVLVVLHVLVTRENGVTSFYVNYVPDLSEESVLMDSILMSHRLGSRDMGPDFDIASRPASMFTALAHDKTYLDFITDQSLLSSSEPRIPLDTKERLQVYERIEPRLPKPMYYSGNAFPTLYQAICEIGMLLYIDMQAVFQGVTSLDTMDANVFRSVWNASPIGKCDTLFFNACALALPTEVRRIFAVDPDNHKVNTDDNLAKRIMMYFIIAAHDCKDRGTASNGMVAHSRGGSMLDWSALTSRVGSSRKAITGRTTPLTTTDFFPEHGTDAWYIFHIVIGFVLNRAVSSMAWKKPASYQPSVHSLVVMIMESLRVREVAPNMDGFANVVSLVDALVMSRVGAFINTQETGGELVKQFRQVRLALYRMSFYDEGSEDMRKTMLETFLAKTALPGFGLMLSHESVAKSHTLNAANPAFMDSVFSGRPVGMPTTDGLGGVQLPHPDAVQTTLDAVMPGVLSSRMQYTSNPFATGPPASINLDTWYQRYNAAAYEQILPSATWLPDRLKAAVDGAKVFLQKLKEGRYREALGNSSTYEAVELQLRTSNSNDDNAALDILMTSYLVNCLNNRNCDPAVVPSLTVNVHAMVFPIVCTLINSAYPGKSTQPLGNIWNEGNRIKRV